MDLLAKKRYSYTIECTPAQAALTAPLSMVKPYLITD